jgi:hypothetical protein
MKRILLLAALMGLLLFNYSIANGAALEIVPSAQTVLLGDSVDIEIAISGLGSFAAPSLGAFDLDLSFDNSILSFTSAAFGDQLDVSGFGSNPRGASEVGGVVDLFEISLDSPVFLDTFQLDSFTLATLTFGTLDVGTSTLALSNVFLSDALGVSLGDVDVTGGSVGVAAVPEPATIFLLGSGLIGLAGYRRRKFKKQ